jgi:flagellar biosynthesis chaperone FliJ
LSDLGEDGKEVAIEVLSKLKDLGEIGLKTGIRWYGRTLSKLIEVGMDMIGANNILETPFDQLAPELNRKVMLLASVLKELSANPATKQAVKEIAEAVAITMVEVLKEIQPQVNKVVEQATEMTEQVSDKVVSGAVGTGITVAQAFISEIPFFGGVINLIIAIAKGFNALMMTFKVFVEKSSPMVITAAQTIKNTENTALKGKERIMSAVDNAANTLQTANKQVEQNTAQQNQVQQNTVQQRGGDNYKSTRTSTRPINYKIQKGGDRLNKTIKLFRKTLPTLKFSYANKTPKRNKRAKTKKSPQTGGTWNAKKTRKN